MYCIYCGTKLVSENAIYCINCGKKQSAEDIQVEVVDPAILKKRKSVLWLGIISLLMSLGGWFVPFIIIAFFTDYIPVELMKLPINPDITFSVAFVLAWAITVLISALNIVKGNRLHEIGQLKRGAANGRRCSIAAFWIITVVFIIFFIGMI